MKKNFKFMLVGLLAIFGVSLAWSDDPQPVTFEDGNYIFEVTAPAGTNTKGTVKLLGLTDAAKALKNTDGQEPYINNGKLDFPGTATDENGKQYKVTEMKDDAFAHVAYYATSVTIPASLTEIPEAAFNTLTNLASIEFEPESQVKKIGAQAFASTRITEFDFTNCVELEGLKDEVFVERSTTKPNPNTNSYITKVKVPTAPNFKHINGAFRNLTELTEIENLENSWIQEIVDSAFAGTKIGTTQDKPLVLPEKDLLYISKEALGGSNVAYMEIKMGSVLYVGGCNVTYEMSNAGEYTYTYTPAEAVSEEGEGINLYGLTAAQAAAQTPVVAPLVSLKLTGTQKGKICKNAFLACEKLNGLDLTELEYGSKAQFETSSFEGCKLITSLVINDINNNETGAFTFMADAFKGCPIETLTMNKIGTANAVGAKAFCEALKTVTIGTVDAGAAAFAEDAFTFGKVSGAELFLAQGEEEFLNSKDAQTALIPAHAFDFSAIYRWAETDGELVRPVVTIGEIASRGAAFADGAIFGPVEKIEFTGDIARNGLTVGGNEATPAGVKILAEEGESVFKTLIFGDGAIETNGIGSGAFEGFTALETVTFNGLLAENAVASRSFTGSGKLGGTANDPIRYIGTKDAPFVSYTVTGIENWAVNPFAKNAFSQEDGQRVIWWSIADETLNTEISWAIHKAYCTAIGEEYDLDREYSEKFNVYKWVDILYVTPEVDDEGPNFLFFQDKDTKVAWGRYDLGSFTNEKGKYAREIPTPGATTTTWVNDYKPTDMVIPRIQETGGVKVKVTLYGLYWDEDDFGKVSTTYLVPLRVVNGTYQISKNNQHLIIGKAEIQGEGSFEDKDVKIYYNNVPADVDGSFTPAWKAGGVTEYFEDANNAVWEQLATEERVYKKATAADAKTHQELWDMVARYEGGTEGAAVNTSGKNLWVMTDPAKYKGFRVDSNPIEKDNYTFIGEGWYYVLLNNYQDITAPARVIWLDEAQATAIFGVKELKAKAAAGDGAIYNLQGIRVINPTKGGVYIQNGKKFIVK